MNPGPPDLGVAAKGVLRPLIGDFHDSRKSYALQHIWAYDRTLTEWNALIKSYIEELPTKFWGLSLTSPSHPWHEYCKTGETIQAFFIQNQRMRWIARKWIMRCRTRIMKKRVIGIEDIYTCAPIPANARVQVFDYKTRSVYQFHTNTMIKLILTQLNYGSYGIPSPTAPKNPYTNIPWNIVQLISILSQITMNLMNHHRVIPELLYNYRVSGYNLAKFYAKSRIKLCINTAISFFKNTNDPDAQEIFIETYEDLADYTGLPLFKSNTVKQLIKRQKISKELYTSWVDLIISYWIYSNHAFFYKINRMEDFTTQFQSLFQKTRQEFRNTIRRQDIIPPVAVIPIGIISIHNSVSATTATVELNTIGENLMTLT